MSELPKLPNIRKILEEQLLQVGIDTPEKLKEVGSKQAWLSIKTIDPSACYNRLCALEGAIQGVRWHFLSDDVKHELKEFYNSFKL
ncbi:TfoX/Sxy family protein [Anaerovorax odorimutans]|uniref:TfoX/Sxy family protein n=1 Tax=Anaerovorax odorimutans TaxID=109327 RepID=UPI000424668A|nr:TfoX/Sxy family protein [Anaerovorax odorimutans]